MDYKVDIKNYIAEEKKVLDSLDVNVINQIMNEINESKERGASIYICGNGGSAATASHFCCDFNRDLSGKGEKTANFICLSDNVPTMMAIANDFSYDEIFSYQLKSKLKPGDILFVISGSGNSKNIVKAMEVAKQKGNKIIGLCGYDGGKVKEMSDICLHVNVNNMQIVEDIHMMLDHCMMYIMYMSNK